MSPAVWHTPTHARRKEYFGHRRGHTSRDDPTIVAARRPTEALVAFFRSEDTKFFRSSLLVFLPISSSSSSMANATPIACLGPIYLLRLATAPRSFSAYGTHTHMYIRYQSGSRSGPGRSGAACGRFNARAQRPSLILPAQSQCEPPTLAGKAECRPPPSLRWPGDHRAGGKTPCSAIGGLVKRALEIDAVPKPAL